MTHRLYPSIVSLLLALAYFVTGRLGLLLPAFESQITLIWLPTGIAVAALLRYGFRCWPGVALGAVAVNFAISGSVPLALEIAVGNTLAPLLSAWVLQRLGFHPAFDRKRDIFFLSLAAIAGMLVSASLGVTFMSAAGVVTDGRIAAWLIWWARDAMGVIIAAPLVLAITGRDVRAVASRRAEFSAWLCVAVAAMWGVFVLSRGPGSQTWSLAFVPLPLVAWAALRYGPVGTSVALIVMSVVAAYATATERGPFLRPSPIEWAGLLWIFMATAAVLGWLITALQTARRHATGIQNLFEQALSDVSLGVVLAGLDRKITFVNEGFARLTGYAEAEVLGKSCSILQGPATDAATVRRLKEALQGDGFFDGEMLNYRKDAKPFWNGLLVSPVNDARGVMTGYLGIQRDITKRKQTEIALHQSEEHLRTIIALEPECVKLLSPEGNVIELNPAGLAMIGAGSLDEIRGKPMSDLIVPEDRERFFVMHRRALNGETVRGEFSLQSLRGTRRWVETNAVPYRNARREIIGVLGITRDITARKDAVADLERSLATLKLFIDSVPAYIAFVDGEERYGLVNRRYEEYFQRSAEELVGKHLREVQSAAAYEAMQPHVRAALAGKNVRYQANPSGLDGEARWFDVHYVPRLGKDGVVSGFFVLVFDITERKQAELALSESEERFRQLIEHAPEVIMLLDVASGQLMQVNSAAERLFKLPAAELCRRGPIELSPSVQPDGRPSEEKAREFIGRAVAGEVPVFEWTHRDAEGRDFPCEVRLLRIDIGGRVVLRGSTMDITERKRTLDRLEDSEERLRLALSAAHQGLYDLDLRTYESIVSPEYARMLGYEPAEFHESNREWRERLHPEDRERACGNFDDYVSGKSAEYRVEFRLRTKDGDWKWILSLGSIVARSPDGKPLRMLGTHTDITERKHSEEALREREERLRVALAASGTGTFRWEIRENVLTWDEALDALFGLPPGKAVRSLENFIAKVHPEDRFAVVALFERCALDGADFEMEFRVVRPDGSVRWVDDRGKTFRDPAGRPLHMTGACVDITERKRAEVDREKLDRKVQEAQKLESLGVLAGGIAHDFNNLLTTILGNASLAAMEISSNSAAQECLGQISEASHRAADLCKQMLAYSGRGRFVVQTLDLGQLLEETAQMMQISISKKAVLRFRLEKNLPPVEMDATQIRQIIMNLVINASEAIGDKSGVISISTGLTRVDRGYLAGTLMDPNLPEGEYVFLEVSDNGCGMSSETQAKIFDPFYTTKFTGRGLGLAAVLGIVRGHKGAMKVYSEVGRGSTFKLLFPIARGTTETPAAEPPGSTTWRGHGTVLVVDDEETMRSTVARLLRHLGLDPVLVADGREAVEIFRATPARFALVLLDLSMPHMDGEQTFAELRRLRPDVCVVLMSGFNAQEAMVRFTGKGLASFLQKPFAVGELRTVLHSVLG